jgi:uncharacterized membrane protein
MRHLDHDYHVTHRPTGFIPHFWDTIDSVGGVYGLIAITIGIVGFYYGVLWYILYSRAKREAKAASKRK